MEMRYLDLFGRVLTFIAVLAAAFMLQKGLVHFRAPQNTVQVKGLSERLVKSDQAVVNFAASIASANLTEMNTEILRVQKAMVDFLKSHGFGEAEIALSAPSISDRWSSDYSETKTELRYVARPSVMLDTQNIDKVNEAVQKSGDLISQGITMSSVSISYYFNGLNEIKPDMVKEATQKAKESAESFAELSNSTIGKIKSASQGTFSISSPTNDYDANSSVMKKVRVVTDIQYYLD